MINSQLHCMFERLILAGGPQVMTSRLWSCNSIVEGINLLGPSSMTSPDHTQDVAERIRAPLTLIIEFRKIWPTACLSPRYLAQAARERIQALHAKLAVRGLAPPPPKPEELLSPAGVLLGDLGPMVIHIYIIYSGIIGFMNPIYRPHNSRHNHS